MALEAAREAFLACPCGPRGPRIMAMRLSAIFAPGGLYHTLAQHPRAGEQLTAAQLDALGADFYSRRVGLEHKLCDWLLEAVSKPIENINHSPEPVVLDMSMASSGWPPHLQLALCSLFFDENTLIDIEEFIGMIKKSASRAPTAIANLDNLHRDLRDGLRTCRPTHVVSNLLHGRPHDARSDLGNILRINLDLSEIWSSEYSRYAARV